MADVPLKDLVLLAQEKLVQGDVENALEHFKSAVTLCNQQQVVVEKKLPCLANIGACLVTLDRYQESLEYLNEAVPLVSDVYITEETEDDRTHVQSKSSLSHRNISEEGLGIKGDLTYNLASSHIGLQDYQQAVVFIKTSIDCYMKAGRTEQAADAFLVLARCEKHNGQTDAELQSLKSARQLFADLGADDKEGFVLGEMVLLLMSCRRENGELEKCIGSAKLVSLRMNDKREKGHLLMKLGIVKASQKSFPEAVSHLKESLPLVRSSRDEEVDSVYYEASILQNIGAIYNEVSKFDEALPFHEEAVKLHSRYGSTRAEAKSLCNKSIAEVKLGLWPEAEHSLELALQKSTEANDVGTQFQTHEGLGSIFFRAEKLDEAKRHFELALSCLETIGGNIGLVRERVLEKMADVIEAQIVMKEKMLKIDYGIEGTDGTVDSPPWFSTRRNLPPLITSTPMPYHSNLGPRAVKLPPLNLDEADEGQDGLYNPAKSTELPYTEEEPLEIQLNFTAKSALQEVVIFDHKKKTLASEQELEHTLKSLTEVLTPVTTAKTVSSNGEVFTYSTHVGGPKPAFVPLVRGASSSKAEHKSHSQIARRLEIQHPDDDLQRAYIDTYAGDDSDLDVSITPDSFTEEDIDVSDQEHPKVFSSPTHTNTELSATFSTQDRVKEGSLAIGEGAREKYVATQGSGERVKKKHKKKQPKEPIKPRSETGEDEPDYVVRDKTVTTTSKVCVIL